MFALYLLTQENGALLSASNAMYLHELTHDARHALGVGAVLAADCFLRGVMTDPVRVSLDVVVGALWVMAMLVFVPELPDNVPADVPAELLWEFRLASLAQLAAMWLVVGVVLGPLVDGRSRRTRRVARSTA